MMRESRDHQCHVETDELLRSGCGASLQQHVEPYAKPIGIEEFVDAWRATVPEIGVQNARKLRRRGEGHEFGGILEPTDLNDAVKNFRRKVRNGFRQVVCIQQAIE